MAERSSQRLGDICFIEKGVTGIASAIPGDFPLVTTAQERKTCSSYQFDADAVCIPLVSSTGHGKKTLNYVHFQSGKFALGSILAAVIPKDPRKVSAAYIHRYFQYYKATKLVSLMKGAANVSLAIRDIANVMVELPSLAEQRLFVVFFDKSEGYSEQLSTEYRQQESMIGQLRQSILQEASEGKLTADWRKKHPYHEGDPERDGAALLRKIREEKKKLVAEGKSRKEKAVAPISPGEVPFELPAGWVWTRLGQLSSLITSGSRNWKDHYSKQGSPLIRSQDIKHDYLEFDDQVYVELSGKVEGDRTKVCLLDLLLTITGGNVGKCALLNIEFETAFVSQHVALIRLILPRIAFFVHKWLTSPMGGRGLLLGASYGDKPGLNLMQLNDLIIPLPTLAEQDAIVERVEGLLTHVDELEKEVAARKGHTEELMRVVLQQALGSV